MRQVAKQRLMVVVPITLGLVMVLLYGLFNSLRDSLLAVAGIPFAIGGGLIGGQVQRPLATVCGRHVIGPLLLLVVARALRRIFLARDRKEEAEVAEEAPGGE